MRANIALASYSLSVRLKKAEKHRKSFNTRHGKVDCTLCNEHKHVAMLYRAIEIIPRLVRQNYGKIKTR